MPYLALQRMERIERSSRFILIVYFFPNALHTHFLGKQAFIKIDCGLGHSNNDLIYVCHQTLGIYL